MYFATASLQKYVSEQRCHAQSMLLKGGAEDVKHDHTDLWREAGKHTPREDICSMF